MSNQRNLKLLREYVRESLLLEDDGYGGGIVWGSEQDLLDTFVGPFVDVFKTAVGKSKEIGVKAKTLINVSLTTLLTTLVPVIGANYSDVFDKEKEQIKKIRDEYKDVYERTDKALASGDAAMLAFMASPAVTVGAFAAKKAPGVTKDVLSAMTGGVSDDVYDGTKSKLEKLGRWAVGDAGEKSPGEKSSKRSPSDMFGEAQLHEDEGAGDKKKSSFSPEKLMKNKKFLAKVLNNPKTKAIAAAAQKTYRASLSEVVAQAETIAKKTRSVEDVEKALGKKLKPDMKAKIAEIKKLSPEEKAKAEKMLIDGLKKSTKDFYVKSLTAQVDSVIKAGIPEDADYVKDYRKAITTIKAM